MAELTVILKDTERTYRQKFLVYEPINLNVDPMPENILLCIAEAKENFQGDPETIQIKIHIEIQ